MPGHSFAFGVGYPELLVNCSAMYPLETEFWCSSFDISRGTYARVAVPRPELALER